MHTAVAVFSGKSKQHILADRGTQSWRLVPRHAAKHEYVVCCRSGISWAEGPEARGSAFLVGRIGGITKATDPDAPERFLILMSEYAEVDVPGAWKGWRNPVKYTTLEELGIEFSTLKFQSMPVADQPRSPSSPRRAHADNAPLSLTIAQAKLALATHYGVAEECVEITIRG